MPRPTKRKAAHKKVNRNEQGKFTKEVEVTLSDMEVDTLEEQSEIGYDALSEYDWENDEVSDWGSDFDLEEGQDTRDKLLKVDFGLKWRPDAKLEREKRGPYKTGKIPKSTYYDKWGPSGTWTKAAKGTPKLESFFNQQDGSMQEGYQNILLDEETSALTWPSENMVLSLERDLKENFNGMLAKDYVKKRAIFEYFVHLLEGEKKMKASMDVVKIVYNSSSKSTATWV